MRGSTDLTLTRFDWLHTSLTIALSAHIALYCTDTLNKICPDQIELRLSRQARSDRPVQNSLDQSRGHEIRSLQTRDRSIPGRDGAGSFRSARAGRARLDPNRADRARSNPGSSRSGSIGSGPRLMGQVLMSLCRSGSIGPGLMSPGTSRPGSMDERPRPTRYIQIRLDRIQYVCNMAKLATRYPRVYDRLLEDASRAADFEAHVQRAGFQMATVKDAATQRPAEIIALRSKAALDDLMAKCALDLQQAYLASREWGVSTVLTMRGRDKLRRLSDTTFAIAVVSMMGFGLHELINVKPTDKCPLCSSKTPQPRLTREHLLTCRIKRHNALRDEMGRLLRYATLSHVWVEKSGYNANGQSCRIDLHCRNPFPGGTLGPALPDLGIDVTVRTAQPPTTSQACIKVGAALRRAEKEKRDY
ncbi:uncharacterized protein MONBRDRAFT_12401 [Monosiga brevicollis MX1]|uniref:Uncharacterized protein n=1 Tax=Monosiga brevicollis TaxID=81824 RepID=A9VC58_MONBE|nr:uncharacterized protein MONBRDRAFT_12401 [Monosiga brevicollis MX1]EDQ84925.1 predicted protein [Monosiga brevicollis MX1]|eukprot:XP_001750266.1 hypothetical protein [Monosiga brevicollis MX1]